MNPLLALVVGYFAAKPESSRARMYAALAVWRVVSFRRWHALAPQRRQNRERRRAWRWALRRVAQPRLTLNERLVEVFAARPRAAVNMLLLNRLPHRARKLRMRAAHRHARWVVREAHRRYPQFERALATTNFHTDVASGAAADAAVVNAPLGQLDQALSDLSVNLKRGTNACVGDGSTDDTANFLLKIAATPAGGVLYGPVSNYLVTSAGAECLKFTHPIHFVGAGDGTVILVKTGTGAAVDVIHVVPATATSADATMYLFEDFRIVAQSGTPARHAFNFDASALGVFMRTSGVSRVWTDPLGGNSIQSTNNAGNANGAIFTSSFRDSFFGGGINFTGAGDSLNVEDNSICNMSNGTNAGGVTVNLVAGAGKFRFTGNNFQGTGGLIVTAGIAVSIIDNEFELPYAFTGSNTAMVNLSGSVAALQNVKVEDNEISILAGGGAVDAIRCDHTTGAKIDDNWLNAPTGNSHINLTANAVDTKIGSGNSYNGAGAPFTNLGTATTIQSAPLYYSQIADSAAIASTNVETAFNKTFVIPANELRAGDVIRIRAHGVLSSVSTPTATMRLRMGATSVGGSVFAIGALTGVAWSIESDVLLRSITTGNGTFQPTGRIAGIEAASLNQVSALGTLVLAVTGTITVDVTWTWSVSSASNTATMRGLTVEILRAGSVS